jgi:uridine phosphorylase
MLNKIINFGLKFMSVDDKIVRMFLQTRASKVRDIVILPAIQLVTKKLISQLKNTKEHGRIYNGDLNGIEVSIIRSLVGCPNAAVTVESLKRCGTRAIIRVDFCGGIQSEKSSVSIGDILIPNISYCGDGTSPQYVMKYASKLNKLKTISNPIPIIQELKSGNQNLFISEPDEQLKDLLREEGVSLYPEKVKAVDFWTTDALFCENELFIKSLKSIGVQGIDMENSIIFLLSKLFDIKAASVLAVSDLPGHSKYDLFNSNVIHTDMMKGINKAIDIVVNSLPKIKSLVGV